MGNFDYENIPIGYYDKVLIDGIRKNKGIQANWHNKKFSKVYERISESKTHLDYGCGPGTFIGNYSEIESVGVDISEIQIEYAKKKYGDRFLFRKVGDEELENLNYKFDCITMIELIEHLNDDEIIKILDKLYELLDSGGKIVLTTPNFRSFYSIIEMVVNLIGKVSYKDQHINKFNQKKLINLLSKGKFTEINLIKFINIGIFFSIINIDLALKINNFLERLFKDKFGYLLLVELKK
tara:strand:- start:89 stop:802 length:714 start_codon:yes stop_codon:yes gene_type:complete